ncbi:MAG: V-type ATP synthase subunit A [Clostridium sp.]
MLSAPDRLKLEAARSVREDFLQQNAFNEVDMFTPLEKQYLIMKLVLRFYDDTVEALKRGAPVDELVKLPVRERIGRFKYVPADKAAAEFDEITTQIAKEIEELLNRKEDF